MNCSSAKLERAKCGSPKGGDPCFRKGGEEAEKPATRRLRLEVVPGASSCGSA
jgi:siroheme synthase